MKGTACLQHDQFCNSISQKMASLFTHGQYSFVKITPLYYLSILLLVFATVSKILRAVELLCNCPVYPQFQGCLAVHLVIDNFHHDQVQKTAIQLHQMHVQYNAMEQVAKYQAVVGKLHQAVVGIGNYVLINSQSCLLDVLQMKCRDGNWSDQWYSPSNLLSINLNEIMVYCAILQVNTLFLVE